MLYGGLDIGSTNVKFAVYDLSGRLITLTSSAYKSASSPFRFSLEHVWDAVREVMVCASRSIEQINRLRGIAISACGEIVVPVDENGKELCEGFIGSAPEGEAELAEILSQIPSEEIYRITGLLHDRKYSASRLLWYRKNTIDTPSKYLFVEDYLINRLTGIAVVSASVASRSMLFDITQGGWSQKLMKAIHVNESELSSPVPSGTYIGTIRPEIAFELGLSGNVKVFAGGHDQLCNAIGSGAINYETAFNCSGTFECIGLPVSRKPDHQAYCERMQIVPFYREPLRMAFWAPVAGTAGLDWFARSYDASQSLGDVHLGLQQGCDQKPSSVLCLPYFTGRNYPDRNPGLRVSFLNVDLCTTPEAIYQSILEGITFELRECLDRFISLGCHPRQLRLSGGGSKSPYWSQMRADILNCPVEQIHQAEPGTLGSMMIAAVGDGAFASIPEAVNACVRVRRTFEPNPVRAAWFEEKRQLYLAHRSTTEKGDAKK